MRIRLYVWTMIRLEGIEIQVFLMPMSQWGISDAIETFLHTTQMVNERSQGRNKLLAFVVYS